MKIYLTVLFCILAKFKSTNCDIIYVCPVDMQITSKLIDYRQMMICKSYKNLCELKKEFTSKFTYQNTLIIVHKGEWSMMNDIGEKLSACGIPYLTLDMEELQYDLSSFCSTSRTTLIFSVTNETNNLFDKWSSSKTCSVKHTNVISEFYSTLVETCPSSIFIAGDTICQNEMFSYGIKLQGKISSANGNVSENSDQISRIISGNIKVGTLQYIPFSNITIDNGTTSYEGVVKEMMEKIAKATGFAYTIVKNKENKAGIFSNGSWDGLVGMLVRKEIDMIAAPLTVTYSRSQFINFSPPYYFESIGILIKKPKLVPRLWRAFTLFTASLWAVILLAAVITVVLLYVLHVYAAMPTDTGFERITDCIWYVVACMSNQAHEINPGSWAAQNYLAFWWLYVVAIIAIYGGVLISLLTNKTTPLPFTTLTELASVLDNDGYKVCVQASTGFHDRILTSDAYEHVSLRNWLYKHPDYLTSNDLCIQKLLNVEDVAYLGEVTRLQELQKAYCNADLILLNDRFYPGWFSFAYQINSPLLYMQMQTISEVTESGLIDGWKMKYSNKTKPCRIITPETLNGGGDSGSQSLNMDPLTLFEVGGPFVLLTVGLVLSLAFFFLEFNKRHMKNNEKQGNLRTMSRSAEVDVIKVFPDNVEKAEIDKGMYSNYTVA